MANITAALVKELRERTGAGMMDCKKALVAADGDIEVAIDNMRKNGQAKAAKKAGRVTAEGVIAYASNENKAYIVEINCETDFVAKDAGFNEFCNNVARVALEGAIDEEAGARRSAIDRAAVSRLRRVSELDPDHVDFSVRRDVRAAARALSVESDATRRFGRPRVDCNLFVEREVRRE